MEKKTETDMDTWVRYKEVTLGIIIFQTKNGKMETITLLHYLGFRVPGLVEKRMKTTALLKL